MKIEYKIFKNYYVLDFGGYIYPHGIFCIYLRSLQLVHIYLYIFCVKHTQLYSLPEIFLNSYKDCDKR